ncbi:uncharacterized protein Dana_GF24900 [Drosophila ananassae]|uniref:Uncharacterized protein n=1 Tax=Drosophila ananassae TaxID=7217 RepID=B3M6L8_DROAN|nr:uncharacterized protein LOC6507528 [Drosophila ananassae]EDV38668.2 uncharacterized protein Dana_GF24900 [Drosophila ananassae]
MADVEEEEAPPDLGDEQPEGEEDEEAVEAEELEGEDAGEEEDEGSEGEEEDLFELLVESESDDEEERAMYQEYLAVINAVDAQNLVIQELKDRAAVLMAKQCKTFRDKEEYKRLRTCMEQEDFNLRTLINRAVQLQNFGSRRMYGAVEMQTTEAEGSFFTGLPTSFPAMQSEECCLNKGLCCSDSDSDSDSSSNSNDNDGWVDCWK